MVRAPCKSGEFLKATARMELSLELYVLGSVNSSLNTHRARDGLTLFHLSLQALASFTPPLESVFSSSAETIRQACGLNLALLSSMPCVH